MSTVMAQRKGNA